ncbi:MAG TPA: hypothetical protein VE093_40830 [Polyangiaceae bacterium]|nr:hypothetical protein [Polyangiaceae bacterium]
MVKVDFKKEMKALYNPPVGKFEIIEVPPLTYFMVNGTGDPKRPPPTRRPSRRFMRCPIR